MIFIENQITGFVRPREQVCCWVWCWTQRVMMCPTQRAAGAPVNRGLETRASVPADPWRSGCGATRDKEPEDQLCLTHHAGVWLGLRNWKSRANPERTT